MSDVDVLGYLQSKGMVLKRASGDEVHTSCFLCGEDPQKRGRLYINVNPGADIPGLYHCKVCDARGALPSIKKHFGDYTKEQEEADDSYQRRLILEEASNYYHEALSERLDIVRYLRDERGLTVETMQHFQLGYADGGLFSHLRTKGYPIHEMEKTGLIREDFSTHKMGDFLQHHITIPYRVAGNIVCIRGRDVSDEGGGKYVTPPGQKSRLFNSDVTWTASEITVTEGEFDCYSGDTEVLTDQGWLRLDQYDGRPVVQWDDDRRLSVVTPSAFIEKDVERTLHFSTVKGGGISLVVTPGHRMVSVLATDHSVVKVHRADEPASGAYHIPRAGLLNGPGLDYSDDELRLLVALSADAYIDRRLRDGRQWAGVGLKKERKIERIRKLLSNLGIEFTERRWARGVTNFRFMVPAYLEAFKVFPTEWLVKASLEQRQLILSELVHWDGNQVADRQQHDYSTTIYENACWVQALAHTCGYVGTLKRGAREHYRWFEVSILYSKSSTSWQSIRSEDAGPQRVYCLEVPSGKLLVRHNDLVSVSGNCMVLHQAGFDAVGVPGAMSWQDSWDGYFKDARRAYIVFDTDSTGVAAALKVAERLSPRSRIVNLPVQVEGQKVDVSDWIVRQEHSGAEFAALLKRSAGGLLVSVDDAIAEHAELQGQAGLILFHRDEMKSRLDMMLSPGLLPSQVMVFIAKSGTGKTLLLLNLFQRVAELQPDHKILFVSLEQTRGDWWERARRIFRFFHEEATDQDAADFWRDRLLIVDRNRLTEEQLHQVVDDFEYEMGRCGLLAIDYLGYFARGYRGEPYQRTGDAIMGLKALAKDRRIPLVTPHQVSRMTMYGSEPTVDSARDSGVIEETADFVLPLWSPDNQHGKQLHERSGELKAKIGKSRHGGTGVVQDMYFAPLSLAIALAGETELAQRARDELYYQAEYNNTWEEALMRHSARLPKETSDMARVRKVLDRRRQAMLT